VGLQREACTSVYSPDPGFVLTRVALLCAVCYGAVQPAGQRNAAGSGAGSQKAADGTSVSGVL